MNPSKAPKASIWYKIGTKHLTVNSASPAKLPMWYCRLIQAIQEVIRYLFLATLALACAACNRVVGNTHTQQSSPAYLADTTSTVITSSGSGRTYQISVALPDGYTKTHAPYAVLYAADANAEFGIVVETARGLALEKDIPDLVIVGIGYPNPGQGLKASNVARTLDLTPTPDPVWIREQAADAGAKLGVPAPQASGGAAEFLSFLRSELIPSIESDYNVSHDDRAWFGHSFGGLFGTYVLFHNDGLFRRFVIGSPSLWWDHRTMFSFERSFAGSSKPLPVRAYFAVGLLEQMMAPQMPMVSDLREFTDRLKRRNYRGLEFEAHFFEDEDHGSVIPATVSKGLRYVYLASPPRQH